jgi:hypothetical protein
MTAYVAPKLTRRTVLMAAFESTYGTAAVFNPATDALLIDDVSYSTKFDYLERKYLSPSLSRRPHVVGDKSASMKFTVELALNGLVNSGDIANLPVIGRLFEACSMTAVGQADGWSTAVNAVAIPTGSDAVEFVTSGTIEAPSIVGYTILCTEGGVSGTAQVSIMPHDPNLDAAQVNQTLTSGSALTVGSLGLKVTPTFTGSLVVGQSWFVAAMPPGIALTPISAGAPSLSLEFFVDGSLHLMTGCYGTFSIKADGSKLVTVDFEFMGFYDPYVDQALPTPTYNTLPPPVFLGASLALGSFQPIVTSLTFDIGVKVEERNSVNSPTGLYGMIITEREAKGGLDPEATSAASQDFWDAMANAASVPLLCTIGTQAGNRLGIVAPNMQYTGLTYKDRNSIRAYDASLAFNQVVADDEVILHMH